VYDPEPLGHLLTLGTFTTARRTDYDIFSIASGYLDNIAWDQAPVRIAGSIHCCEVLRLVGSVDSRSQWQRWDTSHTVLETIIVCKSNRFMKVTGGFTHSTLIVSSIKRLDLDCRFLLFHGPSFGGYRGSRLLDNFEVANVGLSASRATASSSHENKGR